MADVFISYASEDRERTRPLAEALEARGLTVWWDRVLAAGDNYAQTIQTALEEARSVVVVWSRNSIVSPWVLDEAGRARDSKRLVSVLLDKVALPSGYGAVHAQDFTEWKGSKSAPQLEFLASALAARGRQSAPSVSEPALASPEPPPAPVKRVRLFAALAIGALLAAIAAGGIYLAMRGKSDAAIRAQMETQNRIDLARLLGLVASGKINGEQAVELSGLLQRQAFRNVDGAEGEPVESARATFQDAAAQLLADPDPQVRAATIAAAAAETRGEGLAELWDIANAYGPSSGAIYRYYAAIGLVTGGARTRVALERARDADPSDLRVWRLLSADYARQGQKNEAQTASLIGEGLSLAAGGAGEQASAILEKALPLLDQPRVKAFVLGQLGDGAAKRDDWAAAEKRYAAAVDIHAETGDLGGAAIDAPKLARAQAQLGDTRKACATLERARKLGVESITSQWTQMCGGPPALPTP
jgi:tetratricopeptide (TPR) repeat protein